MVAIGAFATAIAIGVGTFVWWALIRPTDSSELTTGSDSTTEVDERGPATTDDGTSTIASLVVGPTPTSPTDTEPSTTTAAPTTTTTVAPTTTLLPTTTIAPTTLAPEPTAAPPTPLPGDLAIDGFQMTQPECDDSWITIVGSLTTPDNYQRETRGVLEQFDGSQYLLTHTTCPSLRPDLDGNPIYVVFFGPYGTKAEACAERERGPSDAYVKILSSTVSWQTPHVCS